MEVEVVVKVFIYESDSDKKKFNEEQLRLVASEIVKNAVINAYIDDKLIYKERFDLLIKAIYPLEK